MGIVVAPGKPADYAQFNASNLTTIKYHTITVPTNDSTVHIFIKPDRETDKFRVFLKYQVSINLSSTIILCLYIAPIYHFSLHVGNEIENVVTFS